MAPLRSNEDERTGSASRRARRSRPTSRRRMAVRRRRRLQGTDEAKSSLRNFRQATILAVAITAFFYMLIPADGPEASAAQPQQTVDSVALPDTVSVIEDIAVEEIDQAEETSEPTATVDPDTLLSAAGREASYTVRSLWVGFLANLPKMLVAAVVLLLAGATVKLIRPLLGRVLGEWEKASAATALFGIAIWLLALGIAVSVLAGDIRALVGSVGLVGLALSWALQTPIESFTGWLMNSFQGYYRVGDRIAVGDVFGDVYRIDFLTTTVWEIGSLERPGFVQAEQPTGRLITFPNNEVLAGSIVNLTRDFPYVWDELSVAVGNGSDLELGKKLLLAAAEETVGEQMKAPAGEYEHVLRRSGIQTAVAGEPQIFVSLEESWTNLTVRYLVPARQRRTYKSQLAQAVTARFGRRENAARIISAYPRQQIQFVGADERVHTPTWLADAGSKDPTGASEHERP